MAHGSLILLDDFANRGFEQSFKMHTNFFEDKGLSILTTPAGQGIVLIPDLIYIFYDLLPFCLFTFISLR